LVVKSAKTDYLLNHEQRHFDIAEIFARKLRKELEEYTFNKNNLKEIENLYKKYLNKKSQCKFNIIKKQIILLLKNHN